MRIAVTGASGFLGRHLLNRLRRNNRCEALPLSHSSNLEGAILWDAVMSAKECASILRGCDAVIHTAAYVPANHRSSSEAQKCIQVNAIGTLNLLEGCDLAGVKRLIFISGANIFAPVHGVISDDSPLRCAHSPYYLGSKLLAEVYVRDAAAQRLDTVIIRPSSIYGQGMRRGVIQVIAEKVMGGQTVELKNNGDYRSDLVHVDDCVSAIESLAVSSFVGEVNIGSGVAVDLRTLTSTIGRVMGRDDLSLKLLPKDRHASEGFAAVDLTKIRSLIPYHPMMIEEGLRKTLPASYLS